MLADEISFNFNFYHTFTKQASGRVSVAGEKHWRTALLQGTPTR
jgi:hypothetical protein